jgi:glycyl-tRNA synthetase beta chain
VAGLKRTSDGILQYEYTAKGVSLQHGLQKAVEQALAKLPIPKLMQYQLHEHCEMPGWSTVSFVRPAHGLVAMHGDQIIHITALGLNATATTLGHRFEALTTPVHIHTADSYEEDLLKNGAVVASFEKRRANIALQLKSVTESLGHDFHCEIDPSLLDEVTALVERPNVISCHFEEQFLKVPQECLILTMKTNQKYFPVLNSNGTLTNHFMVVSNISAKDMSAVKTGNERVVRPRLADAKFFYEQDCKKTLESRINGLEKVVYHHKLGNQLQRMQRVTTVAHQLASIVGDAQLALKASTAARLSKADLLTDMVGEFPELQGIMGAYYARNDGVAPDVAQAIEDHYKPRFAGDQLPMSMVGLVVAMADKMETLVGMFGIGNLPTGDKDPFALRRHALGVIRMLIDKKIPISIQQLIDICASSFEKQTIAEFDKSKLEQFFLERVANLLESEDVIPSHVSAVLESVKLNTWSHVRERLEAVAQFSLLPASEALAAANKRISNILKKSSDFINAEVNQSLLIEKAEQDLYTQLINIAEKADTCFNAGDYKANLTVLAGLRDSVDAFFNEVMVNAEDQAIRQNRLSLLNKLHAQMNQVADLSRLAS